MTFYTELNIDISVSTGVHSYTDVAKSILAGASTAQICSAVYQHGLVSCQSSNDATLSYGRMQVSRDFPSSDRTWKRQKRLDMTLDVVGGMLDGLDAWMTEKSFETIDDFKGYMSYKTVKDSSIYERAQFMKYFSNHG